MLKNIMETLNWLNKKEIDEYSIIRNFINDKQTCIWNTPLKYIGWLEYIGYVTVWNDFGGIDYEFKMYKPINGGTILYEVN